MNDRKRIALLLAATAATCALTRSPAVGLLAGAGCAQFPVVKGGSVVAARVASFAMKAAVVALGFGVQPTTVLQVGAQSAGVTFAGILLVLGLGMVLARLFGLHRDLGALIASGTAICGGSAIAAMSPAIGASRAHTAVSLAVVFLLNGLGVLLFPLVGSALRMSPDSFGLWSALAVHDTAGVVGACCAFDPASLATGTVVKLTRAMWILPVSLVASRVMRGSGKAGVPWFLLGFIAAAFAGEVLPAEVVSVAAQGARGLMVAALFLLGCGLGREELRSAGVRPMLCGLTLWLGVAGASLALIRSGVLSVPLATR